MRFTANWYCTTDVEPAWDLRPTGWRVRVHGDAPLDVDAARSRSRSRSSARSRPRYTANRPVNAVPYVCAAPPGILTTTDLPPITPAGPRPYVGGGRVTDPVFRVLPSLDEPSAFFWTSGADGTLRFLRCTACSYLIHPPAPYCPSCQGRDTEPAVVSGRGTLHSFTVNHQPWDGAGDVYVIGLVEIAEQPDVRLTTNIVDIDPARRAHRHAGRSRLRGPRPGLHPAVPAGHRMSAARARGP